MIVRKINRVEMRIFEDNIFQPRTLSSDFPAYWKGVHLFRNPLIDSGNMYSLLLKNIYRTAIPGCILCAIGYAEDLWHVFPKCMAYWHMIVVFGVISDLRGVMAW